MRMILVLLFLFSTNCWAGVFKCERKDGSIRYQDTSCRSDEKQHTLLTVINPLSKKTIKKAKKSSIKRQQQLAKQKRARDRKAQKEKKQRELQNLKCEKTKEKISVVEAEFRRGYTAKRGVILEQRLAAYKRQKTIYCTSQRVQ